MLLRMICSHIAYILTHERLATSYDQHHKAHTSTQLQVVYSVY